MRARVAVPLSTTLTSTGVRARVTRSGATRRITRGWPKRSGLPSWSLTSLTSRGSIRSPPFAIAPKAIAICSDVTASS